MYTLPQTLLFILILRCAQSSVVLIKLIREQTNLFCNESASYGVRSLLECSSNCGKEHRCIGFVFQPSAHQCQECYRGIPKSSDGDGENVHGRKIYNDCSDPASNFSGFLLVSPAGCNETFLVYCEDGWTVILNRHDGSLHFNRTWTDYKYGFGEPGAEMWLGNEYVHFITDQPGRQYKLKYEMTDWSNNITTREHGEFHVAGEEDTYRLSISASTESVYAGSSILESNGLPFSTSDSDNDLWSDNCAASRSGGWWFASCSYVCLTARYPANSVCSGGAPKACMKFFELGSTTINLKRAVMKIRKVQ